MTKSLLLSFGLVTIGALLVACSQKEIIISPATQRILATQPEIAAIHYSPPLFAAQTPEVQNAASAGMLFDAIGGAIAGAAQEGEAKEVGSQSVKDYGVRVRPIDAYISLFGGIASPLKTDITEGGITLKDSKLDNSPSIGGKVGMWLTAPRKTLGIDFGVEIDITI